MADPLTFGDMAVRDDILYYSAATWATSEIIDKRNEMVQNGQFNALGAKVLCEFYFLGLAIISVIEGIVRGILGIIIGAPLVCCTSNDWAWTMGFGGAKVTLMNALICFIALYQNFSEEELDHDEILPCAANCLGVVDENEL